MAGSRSWRGLLVFASLAAAGAAPVARADPLPQAEALAWLQRIGSAARQLSYAGTFVYQHGEAVETSRIVHLVDGHNEVERLETLDGPRREVVRTKEIVFSYSPDTKTLRVDRRRPSRSFPQLLPEQLTAVTEHYDVRKLDIERVAGHDAQVLVLEPKDSLRYGHRFWAEANSGLLLKAKLIGEGQRIIEQFAFSQVQIGGSIPREWLRPSVPIPSLHTLPELPAQTDAHGESVWIVKSAPSGFRKIMEMRRAREPTGTGHITHIVLSDGLAAVSVFIEQAQRQPRIAEGLAAKGPIHIFTRVVGDQRITVLGEAPAATVMNIANSIIQKPGR